MSVPTDGSDHCRLHPPHPNAALLAGATKGFDFLFANDIGSARKEFEGHDDPFHLLGLGVCAFLEAALGMESGLMAEATRCLALSEAGTRKYMRAPQPRDLGYRSRFPHGLEWEILNGDAMVLLGLTHALSESYMGYLQCIYTLNSAHSKFTKLYKMVFPAGLPSVPNFDPSGSQETSAVSPSLPNHFSRKHSYSPLSSQSSSSSAASTVTISPAPLPEKPNGFFAKWLGGAASSTASLPSQVSGAETFVDGPVEDLIVAGTAYGFGVFNLIFSLLPKKIQGFAGFLGFQHDRRLALQALALSAEKNDVHSVFAGLVLMSYYGAVLLFSGYQADEKGILAAYNAIVDKIGAKYPTGALWILNRAKIMRMSYDAEGAIKVLGEGLGPGRSHAFVQADMMLLFEFAWTLLSQRRYQEAADTFLKITEMNSWSHATYYFIAAGCNLSLGNLDRAQTLLDAIPGLFDKRKISGKDLPSEVFIKRKLAFYTEKQRRRSGGDEKRMVEVIKITPAEEIAIFWNTYGRVGSSVAQAHIDTLSKLTPLVVIPTPAPPVPASPIAHSVPSVSSTPLLDVDSDLDTPDELAIRALLLGMNYRTLKQFEMARTFFGEAHRRQVGVATERVVTSTWVGGVAMFELAVLELKIAEEAEEFRKASPATSGPNRGPEMGHDALALDSASQLESQEEKLANQRRWSEATTRASAHLETALGLLTKDVDLASRLESRIVMLKDQIGAKREMVGLDAGAAGGK